MSEPETLEQGKPSTPETPESRQRRVEALADAYLDRLLAGQAPDRSAFIAEHADLADLLGPRLELVELMHRVVKAQRPIKDQEAKPANVPDERALRVKCPHCRNGIQLIDPHAGEVSCNGLW